MVSNITSDVVKPSGYSMIVAQVTIVSAVKDVYRKLEGFWIKMQFTSAAVYELPEARVQMMQDHYHYMTKVPTYSRNMF